MFKRVMLLVGLALSVMPAGPAYAQIGFVRVVIAKGGLLAGGAAGAAC